MTLTADASTLSSSLATATRAIRPYLDDPKVLEIMCNDDGHVWVDRAMQGQALTDTRLDPMAAEAFLRYVASESGAVITRDTPSLAGTLPHWQARVQGWLSPVVSAPTFSIRKPCSVVLSLDDYVAKQVLTAAQRDALVRAVLDRKNILIGGGTFTGKTTFANALLRVIAEQTNDRLYIAEDTRELQCMARNVVRILTVPGKYEMYHAIRDALRARPDRIIVGELRDFTALDVLKGWGTGHPGGAATIHANDSPGVLNRFCQLIEEKVFPAPRDRVAETINVCVHLTLDARAPAGRRLSGLDAVKGYDPARQRWQLEPLV